MAQEVCLCIHGHFYQPPRENAWTGEIDRQDSASPDHDWNERIFRECYQPQVESKIYDTKGRVIGLANNYEYMNFNFGPTLMSWLQAKHPKTYRRILEADRLSGEIHKGHGNAIAQAYNHMIMPLANRRDKVTQVKWGLEDFRHRFEREPESMWLPETAVNEETLEVLIEEGMKYVILEPHQAEAVRGMDSESWSETTDGSIDPKEPYRFFLKKDPAKFIDIFFYDGPISKAVGFEDVLGNATRFMNRIESAKDRDREKQLIHIATDGETYGHHKPYGDRVLAYLFRVESVLRGYRIVNYGEFLAENAPKMAVRLKAGENNEGTSWSCAHGVKRWKEHCGCRGDGPAEWNQKWRKPLREALDGLRDALIPVFEEEGGKYLKDVWLARNDYIQLILGKDKRDKKEVKAYLERHAKKSLDVAERARAFALLEMERHAMLMYTSCGWFFTEISGIETVQILEYASRALELARESAGKDFEEEFLKRLSEAKSNVKDLGDGRGVYEKFIIPARRAVSLMEVR